MDNLKEVRICRISTVPFFIVSQLKGQVEYLRNLGMRVTLISSNGPEINHIDLGDNLNYEIVDIPRPIKLLKDGKALIKLIRLFHRYRFDIVHSTTPKAGLIAAIAALLTMVPVRLHTFTGQPWLTLRGPTKWLNKMAERIIGVLNTKNYADSESQRQFLIDEKIVSGRRISVIGKGSLAGVDLNRFDPEKWSNRMKERIKGELAIAKDAKVISFVGRIVNDKGIRELLTAFYGLRNGGYNVNLVLVGPLEEQYNGLDLSTLDIREKCSGVHLVGYTECPERYLAISDIFCLPSYREGFGTTVIEAAAMSIPTVGSKIYGLTDAVLDGKTGILVPPRDEKALTKALKYLLDNPIVLGQMGKEARNRCIQNYDAKRLNEAVAHEYRHLLMSSKRYQTRNTSLGF
jgi:glycosyltransferase involved in cell wall biosynthesis